MPPEVITFDAPLGAEVRGVDLANQLTEAAVRTIREAWLDRHVLLFRGQVLSDEQLVAFSRQFGVLEFPPSRLLNYSSGSGQEPGAPPEINVISNVKENGRPIGQLGAGEAAWHTDSAFVEVPPAGSILYSLEIPPSGGNTAFLDMHAALESLPDKLRARLEGRRAKHDQTYTSAGDKRADYDEVTDVRAAPGPYHPLLRTHPETGRKALYLGRRLNCYIEGMEIAESEALLDAVWAHARQPCFVWEHVWRAGDVLMWDNRSVMHRREAFDDTARRIMHRTQIRGERPF